MEETLETLAAKERLKIQHALMAAGYYPYKVMYCLKSGTIQIEARKSIPGYDEKLVARDAEELAEDADAGHLQRQPHDRSPHT